MTDAAATMLVIVVDLYLASIKSLEVGVVDGMAFMVVRWEQRCVETCAFVVRLQWQATKPADKLQRSFP